MKLLKFLKATSVTAAMFGILLPHPMVANASENATATRQAESIRDLELGTGGVLRGQVMNKEGLPESDATVSVSRNGATVATVKANTEGEFTIAGVSGGVVAITSGNASGVVRAWSHGTAPPAASQAVLLVPRDLTVRGQSCLHDWLHHHRHHGFAGCQIGLGGLLVLGLIGTVIAIAVSNDAS